MSQQPMLCSWVKIKDYRFNYATITNEMTNEEYSTEEGSSFLELLRRLDGKTDVYSIPSHYSHKEINEILDELANHGLIRCGRWLNKSLSSFAFTLYIPKKQQTNSLLVKLMNLFLLLSFLPLFIYGVSLFIASLGTIHIERISLPGVILGLFLGIVTHEIAHAISCLAFGGKLYEAGIMLSNMVIPGAYVVMKNAEGLSTTAKIQTVAAGIEANLILSGIAFTMMTKMPNIANFFFCIALINLGLAFLNLVLRSGNDGCHILSYLFGANEEDIVDVAKSTLSHRINRMRLYYDGSVGIATMCSYIMIIGLQIATPIIIVLNIWEVLSWFF